MEDLDAVKHYHKVEKLVEYIINKTQSNNPLFFRIVASFYMAQMASMMRCSIKTHERGVIPVNMYAIALSNSGTGKGYSTNIIEDQIINIFKKKFITETFPLCSEINIANLAIEKAKVEKIDPDDAMVIIKKNFDALGPLPYSFDSATVPAIKQFRNKLLMANIGSMNLIIDEIGSNIFNNVDLFGTFLELYDVGKVKNKLLKNTSEYKREEDIDGRTPANMLLFGTPVKLLDGYKTEEEFYSMLSTGYARRCLFGFTDNKVNLTYLTPEELYDKLTTESLSEFVYKLSEELGVLASIDNANKIISMSKAVALIFLEYKLECEKIANNYSDYADLIKTELNHRYYKALKLAGAYTFVEGADNISEDIAYSAIKLTEESGKAFSKLLSRERNYCKLAKYIASVDKEMTQVDIIEDLPFFNASESKRRELMNLAIAYGYKNNIIIKRNISDGVEFFSGEMLQSTDLDALIISTSNELEGEYISNVISFNDLKQLVTTNCYISNHYFKNKKKDLIYTLPSFNLIIFELENINRNVIKRLMKDYTYILSIDNNKFKLILPLSHNISLNNNEYERYIINVMNWLPFKVTASSKKTISSYQFADTFISEINTGELIDATLFISGTRKDDEQKEFLEKYYNFNNLERWFINLTSIGNRLNSIIKYSYVLIDKGFNLQEIHKMIVDFNNKVKDGITDKEIISTVMPNVHKELNRKLRNEEK